jgi:hypothetical protein
MSNKKPAYRLCQPQVSSKSHRSRDSLTSDLSQQLRHSEAGTDEACGEERGRPFECCLGACLHLRLARRCLEPLPHLSSTSYYCLRRPEALLFPNLLAWWNLWTEASRVHTISTKSVWRRCRLQLSKVRARYPLWKIYAWRLKIVDGRPAIIIRPSELYCSTNLSIYCSDANATL